VIAGANYFTSQMLSVSNFRAGRNINE